MYAILLYIHLYIHKMHQYKPGFSQIYSHLHITFPIISYLAIKNLPAKDIPTSLLWMLKILTLAVNILCVNSVTAAYGKPPPSQGLQSSDAHGHQAHQVEHDAVEALQGAGSKEGLSYDTAITIIWDRERVRWLCWCGCFSHSFHHESKDLRKQRLCETEHVR